MEHTFSENKIIKVSPGKLSKYFNTTTIEQNSTTLGKSFVSSSSYPSGKFLPARLKIYIELLKLSKSCVNFIQINCKGDVFIKLKWTFLQFQEFITSPERLENNKAKFDFTAKYDLDIDEQFFLKLNDNPLTFYLYAESEGHEIFLSEEQYFFENVVEEVNMKKDVRVIFRSNVIDPTAESICFLDIWYKYSCKQKSLRELMGDTVTTKKRSIARLSNILHNRFLQKEHSLGIVHVTDSETDHFSDGLLLVLNRNKVLKTTQSDITTELEERVRWLRFEANWKQTLQEHAILHGKDPNAVIWRQWREEDTANVRLRTYHQRQPKKYKPELSITIVKLIFFEGSSPIKNSKVHQIYVEYTFLNHKGPEMETPFSLPKPKANEPVIINFKRVFDIDLERNHDRCKLLAEMIKKDEKIRFMVISEPLEDPNTPIQTCYELGYADVMLSELIQLEENTDSFEYEIVDIKNPVVVVGYLTIKIQGILAMRKMALDLMAPKNYDLYM